MPRPLKIPLIGRAGPKEASSQAIATFMATPVAMQAATRTPIRTALNREAAVQVSVLRASTATLSVRLRSLRTAFRLHTLRSFVTRPTSTHSTTKMFPSRSKIALWGAMNLPGMNCSRGLSRRA